MPRLDDQYKAIQGLWKMPTLITFGQPGTRLALESVCLYGIFSLGGVSLEGSCQAWEGLAGRTRSQFPVP
jgi:hypothetical protein